MTNAEREARELLVEIMGIDPTDYFEAIKGTEWQRKKKLLVDTIQRAEQRGRECSKKYELGYESGYQHGHDKAQEEYFRIGLLRGAEIAEECCNDIENNPTLYVTPKMIAEAIRKEANESKTESSQA